MAVTTLRNFWCPALVVVLLATLLVASCKPPTAKPPVSPMDVPGADEVTVHPASEYRQDESEECYSLAYVRPDGEVCVSLCWHSAPIVVGPSLPETALSWYAVWDGDKFALWLMFVSADSSVVVYKTDTEELRTLSVKVDPGEAVHYFPDGFMGLDRPGAQAGLLRVMVPMTGLPVLDVTYYHSWSYRPSGCSLALGVPRGSDTVESSDLGLVDLTDGSLQVLREGDRHHFWAPVGWLGPDLLAYENAAAPGEVYWMDVLTGKEPDPVPVLSLALDPLRAAGRIPKNLKAKWTGWYAVSPGEKLLAITSLGPAGAPIVYVGRLSTGDWYEVGPGDRPAWSTQAYEPCSTCGYGGS